MDVWPLHDVFSAPNFLMEVVWTWWGRSPTALDVCVWFENVVSVYSDLNCCFFSNNVLQNCLSQMCEIPGHLKNCLRCSWRLCPTNCIDPQNCAGTANESYLREICWFFFLFFFYLIVEFLLFLLLLLLLLQNGLLFEWRQLIDVLLCVIYVHLVRITTFLKLVLSVQEFFCDPKEKKYNSYFCICSKKKKTSWWLLLEFSKNRWI